MNFKNLLIVLILISLFSCDIDEKATEPTEQSTLILDFEIALDIPEPIAGQLLMRQHQEQPIIK